MKYAAIILCFTLSPALALADTLGSLARLEDTSGLFSSIALWSTIIIAFATTAMVWNGGREMRGGVLGMVLNYFSAGMAVIFLGFATEIPQIGKIVPSLYVSITHSSLFIIGYILMGIAASKLLEVIKGE